MRSAQPAVVDPDWCRQLTALPFRARQSSHNWPVRLGQHFWEDRLRVLLVEGDDATPLRWRRGAQLLPFERRHFRTPMRLEPSGSLLEPSDRPPSWPCREIFLRPPPAPSVPPELCRNKRPARPCIDRELFGKAAPCCQMRRKDLVD